jgi:hypothetical protein
MMTSVEKVYITLIRLFCPKLVLISCTNQPLPATIRISASRILYLFVFFIIRKADNCLIVTLITTNTESVIFSHFKVLCIVAVIIGTPNRYRYRRLWSMVDSGFGFVRGQGMRACIVYMRKITVTVCRQECVRAKSCVLDSLCKVVFVVLKTTVHLIAQRETSETLLSHF